MKRFLLPVAFVAIGLFAGLSFHGQGSARASRSPVSAELEDALAASRARAASALAVAAVPAACPCGCSCTDCGCSFAGQCGDALCTCGRTNAAVAATKAKPARKRLEFDEGLRRARREGKPVVVWVGCENADALRALPECVHCFCAELEDKPTPYVAVLRNGAEADDWSGTGFRHVATAEEIRSALAPAAAAPVSAPVAAPPVFFPPPLMPMRMGGFGGGCST